MGKLIKRKELTPDQYHRANKVMCVIMVICYVVFIGVEYSNIGRTGDSDSAMHRMITYGVFALLSIIVCKIWTKKKRCMIALAGLFLIPYGMLVFTNGAIVIVLVFPVLIGLMIYLNSVVVGLGCIYAFIVCAVKCFLYKQAGDIEFYNYTNLITICFVVSVYGSYRAISLLINFSKEDQSIIQKEAEHRKEVANVVSNIVEKLHMDFTSMVDNLQKVNLAMSSANTAMNSISGSSEDTAQAVNNQMNMTTHIQGSLENTSELANNARATTQNLKNVVVDGKQLADDLQEQSNMVDRNIMNISEIVEQLVNNVHKVSGITDSILKISSQTNLLALNASIEAARAGDAGRGFAVVAEEIRQLAEETKVSTEKISAIIRELNSVTDKTQSGLEESVECINKQREKVRAVNESFETVEHDMFKLQDDVESMSEEVESVLRANSEIVDSIGLLSAASEEVSAGTQTCKDTIDTAFANLENFSSKVDGAFEQLQTLKETTQV